MTTPMRLSMAITADASGVAPGTAEARKEISSVGTEARNATTALSAHAAANDQVAAASRRATEAVRGQSAAERDLRAAVSRFAGVQSPLNDNQFRQRTADIDAYGAGLDRLRARYNPLFAVIQRYKASQAEIRQAHAVGAIGVDEMAMALGRERQAALASIAALKGRSSALAMQHGRAGGAGNFNTANIAAQFQDIGVTSAMGMAPLQIALQQGTQLSAVFEMMKASGQSAGSALLAAFTSVISPVSLVTIGVVGLSAALIQYFASAGDEAKSVDDAMADHLKTIDDVRRLYGLAGSAAEEFGRKSVAATEAAERRARAALRDAIAEQEKAVTASLSDQGGLSGFGLLQRAGLLGDTSLNGAALQFAAFIEPIARLRSEIAAGRPDYEAFSKSLDEITSKDPNKLRPLADELLGIIDTAAGGREQLEAIDDALRDLSTLDPDTSRATNAVKSIGDAASDATARIYDLVLQGAAIRNMLEGMEALARGVAPKGNAVGGRGSLDRAQEEFDAAMEFQRRINPDLFDKIDPMKLKKPKVDRDAKAYRDLIKSADDRIAQMQAEISLTGRVGAEVEALRYEQELLNQATDKGRSLDEKQIAAIKAKAEKYGELKVALAAARIEQDLMFEREQMFRSPTEQRVASTLRSSSIDPASEQGRLIAGQIRLNEQLEIGRELSMDFTSGLFDDLRNGVSLVDALGNAFQRLADQLIQMALDEAINSLFRNLLGSLGGGFGTSDGFANMLGLANGGAFSGGTVVPFARGGAFTNSIVNQPTFFSFANGSKFGQMGEAGPEAVMPLKRNSAGQLGVMLAGRHGGGGDGPSSAPSVIEIIVNGARGNSEIMDMVFAGVSKGIREYDRSSGSRFPRDAKIAKTRGGI